MASLRRVSLLAAFVGVVTLVQVHAAGIPVDGTVLTPDGRPAAGARVELHKVPSLYEAGLRELQGGTEPAPVPSYIRACLIAPLPTVHKNGMAVRPTGFEFLLYLVST